MMGTIDCIYETPCHWCSKWDKKCDRKIDNTKTKCDHQYDPTDRDHFLFNDNGIKTYTIWRCKFCGAEKEVED